MPTRLPSSPGPRTPASPGPCAHPASRTYPGRRSPRSVRSPAAAAAPAAPAAAPWPWLRRRRRSRAPRSPLCAAPAPSRRLQPTAGSAFSAARGPGAAAAQRVRPDPPGARRDLDTARGRPPAALRRGHPRAPRPGSAPCPAPMMAPAPPSPGVRAPGPPRAAPTRDLGTLSEMQVAALAWRFPGGMAGCQGSSGKGPTPAQPVSSRPAGGARGEVPVPEAVSSPLSWLTAQSQSLNSPLARPCRAELGRGVPRRGTPYHWASGIETVPSRADSFHTDHWTMGDIVREREPPSERVLGPAPGLRLRLVSTDPRAGLTGSRTDIFLRQGRVIPAGRTRAAGSGKQKAGAPEPMTRQDRARQGRVEQPCTGAGSQMLGPLSSGSWASTCGNGHGGCRVSEEPQPGLTPTSWLPQHNQQPGNPKPRWPRELVQGIAA